MKKIIKTTAAGIFAIITVLSFAACGNNSSDDNSKAPSPVISEASASNTDMRFVGTWNTYYKTKESSGKFHDDYMKLYENKTGEKIIEDKSYPITWDSDNDKLIITGEAASTKYILTDNQLHFPDEEYQIMFGQTILYYEKVS